MAGNVVLLCGVASLLFEHRMRGGGEGGEEELGKDKTLDESPQRQKYPCVYIHLSSITPRMLLAKKLPVN